MIHLWLPFSAVVVFYWWNQKKKNESIFRLFFLYFFIALGLVAWSIQSQPVGMILLSLVWITFSHLLSQYMVIRTIQKKEDRIETSILLFLQYFFCFISVQWLSEDTSIFALFFAYGVGFLSIKRGVLKNENRSTLIKFFLLLLLSVLLAFYKIFQFHPTMNLVIQTLILFLYVGCFPFDHWKTEVATGKAFDQILSSLSMVGFVAFVHFMYTLTQTGFTNEIKEILFFSSSITALLSGAYLLSTKSPKRLMMSIYQVGMAYLLAGLAIYGQNPKPVILMGLLSDLLFLMVSLFCLYLLHGSKKNKNLIDLRNYPKETVLFILSAFCLVGLPPSPAFVSKFIIFSDLWSSGEYGMVFILSLSSLMVWYPLSSLIYRGAFQRQEIQPKQTAQPYWVDQILFVFLCVPCLWVVVRPQDLFFLAKVALRGSWLE